MKTVTEVKLRTPNTAINIEKGTILKTKSDLFIVSEIEPEEDSINDALFNHSSIRSRSTYRASKYALISLTTGSNFFIGSTMELPSLQHNIRDRGIFQVVSGMTFTETI